MNHTTKKLHIDLLDFDIYVSFHPDVNAAVRSLRRRTYFNHPGQNCDGFCYCDRREALIWISPEANRSTVFHECHHAQVGLCKGINLDGSDEEVNAILQEKICEEVLKMWEKMQKDRKKHKRGK